MAVKRFLLFAGEGYYPYGGWRDFRSSHDTLDEVFTAAAQLEGLPLRPHQEAQ